jgi:hypothetical protein
MNKECPAYNTGFALSGFGSLILICTFMQVLVRWTYSRFSSPTQTQSPKPLPVMLKRPYTDNNSD